MAARVLAVAAGAALVAVGTAGLVRAAVPQQAATSAREALQIGGAFVRAPVPPSTEAAAYFTVRNRGATPDRLVSVQTAAGQASLHTDVDGRMVALATGAVVPAHGSLVLTAGHEHVMLEKLTAPLRAGERVVLALTFRDAGTMDVTATVIAPGAPAPTRSSGSGR